MATVVDTVSAWNQGYRLRIRLERTSVSVANNTSTVRSRVWIESQPNNNGWYYFTNVSSWHAQSIDGVSVLAQSINRSLASGGTALVMDNRRTVTHNAAGNKTVPSAAQFNNSFIPALSHSVSLVLDKITQPTPAVPVISSMTRSGSTITVKWGGVANSDGYTLQHRVNGGSWSTVQVAGTSYNRTGAVAGSKYDFRVLAKAKGNGSNSAYSSVKSLSWNAPVPASPKVTRSGSTLTFSWSSSGQGTVTRYEYRHRVNGGSWVTGSTTSKSMTVTGSAGQKREFQVRVVTPANTSSYTSIVTNLWAPNAPSALKVTRNSDTQHTLNWSNGSTYTSVVVQRSDNDGAWKTITTINSNATSFVDKTTKANSKYVYGVSGISQGGTSLGSNLVTVFTTPAVPGKPTATRLANDDIRVNTALAAVATHFDIQDDGSTIATNVTKSGMPWTHNNPNIAVTHRYRVRASVMSGGQSSTRLYSGWSSYSDVVQLAAPPSAPTNLKPNGAVSKVGATVFSWKHNPVDASEQTGYEMRYRTIGGAWTTLSGTSAGSRTVSLPAGLFEWEARTKGVHPNFSVWSSTANFEVIDAPQASITSPDTDPYLEATVPVEWVFYHAQGKPQSGWRARLLEQGQVVESKSGAGAGNATEFAYRLQDDMQYTVEVEVAAAGIWGQITQYTFETDFVPPAPMFLECGWDDTQGVMQGVAHIAELPGTPIINYAPRIEGSGVWVEVARFDTGDPVPDLGQMEDFRVRDLGNGESVIEGESVASFTHTLNAHAILSEVDERKAIRLISTATVANDGSHVEYTPSGDFLNSGLLFGSAYLLEPITGATKWNARCVGIFHGSGNEAYSANAPNIANQVHPLRIRWTMPIENTVLTHGGVEGSGSVFWTNIGLYDYGYDGPFFDGDSGWVTIDGQTYYTRWNSDGTSTAYPPAPTVRYLIERSTNQQDWETVLESDNTNENFFTDPESLANGTTFYRVTSFASTGASAATIIEATADSEKIWVNAGDVFEQVFWLEYENAYPSITGGRARALFRFAGRSKPVAYAGSAVSRAVTFSGWFAPEQSVDDAIITIQSEAPILQYRDPDGRRIYGVIESLGTVRKNGLGWWEVSGEIVEAER